MPARQVVGKKASIDCRRMLRNGTPSRRGYLQPFSAGVK
jgi:hypothetical protein